MPMSMPKLGPLPAAPPPAPLLPDTLGSQNSQVQSAVKAAGMFGMDGTNLTGGNAGTPNTGGKKLFGQ